MQKYFIIIISLLFTYLFCIGGTCEQVGEFSSIDVKLSPTTPKWATSGNSEADKKKDLKIMFANPRGEITHVRQIIVMFNQPMINLTAIDQREKKDWFEIKPSIKGKYHWLGTSVCSFRPDEPLKFATNYRITVKKGTKSALDNKLKSNYSFSFSTPRPRILWSSPYNGAKNLDTKTKVYISFNQKLSTSKLKSYMKIVNESNSRELDFDIRNPNKKEAKQFYQIKNKKLNYSAVIEFPRELDRNTQYKLTIDKNFTCEEGPRPINYKYQIKFKTYSPLKVTRTSAENKCARSLNISFNNPVDVKQFFRLVSITPAIELDEKRIENYYSLSENSETVYESYIYLPHSLKPGVSYNIYIPGELKDKYGQRLTTPYQFTLNIPDLDPYAYLGANMGLVEANGQLTTPLYVQNVPNLGLQMALLSDKEVISVLNSVVNWNTPKIKRSYDISRDYETDVKKNERRTIPLNLKKVLKDKKYGFILTKIHSDKYKTCYGDQAYINSSSLIQVTDLGIIYKYGYDKTLIWVSSLKKGSPIEGAKVKIYNKNGSMLWTGTTNDKGVAIGPGSFDLFSNKNYTPIHYIIAEKDGDRSANSSSWDSGLSPWSFDLSGQTVYNKKYIKGDIFGERAVYRPGEEIHLKAIVRENTIKSFQTISGRKCEIEIRNPNYSKIATIEGVLSKYGTVAINWKSSKSSKLGYYNCYLKVDGFDNSVYGGFRIEEYRAPDFEVNIKTDKDSYINKEKINVEYSAKYLFGESMSNVDLSYYVTRNKLYYSPRGYDKYWFGQYYDWWDNYNNDESFDYNVHSGTVKLTNDGKYSMDVDIDLPIESQPFSYRIEGTVTDHNKQRVSKSRSVNIHSGNYYIGLNVKSYFCTAGEDTTVKVITVDTKNKQVGGKNIKMKLIKREWHTVKKKDQNDSYRYINEHVDTEVESQDIVSNPNQDMPVTFSIPEGGQYIIRAESTDDSNNKILSTYYIYAFGSNYISWGFRDDDHIELLADKKKYKVGDTAEILIKNPYDGAYALITTEREGIETHEVKYLEGSAPKITIPLKEENVPNLYVSVMLIKGRVSDKLDEKKGDTGKPSFKMGVINLDIDYSHHRLKVDVKSDKKIYKPGEEVNLDLAVKDINGNGVQSELAIMVVDAAVLNLTGFRTPDVLHTFYSNRGLGINTSTNILHIVEKRNYGEKGEDSGGGGAEESEKSAAASGKNGMYFRHKFLTSAYWNPQQETGTDGRTSVSFRLPDSLTRFRVMVVAGNKALDFGSGKTTFNVKKPIMLRPSHPRFVMIGDEFHAGAVIHNYSGKTGDIKFTVAGNNIEIKGKKEQNFNIKPSGAKEVIIPLKAKKAGTAKIRMTASISDGNNTDTDAAEFSFPIKKPEVSEVVATYGVVTEKFKQPVEVPENVRSDLGGIKVSIASTALTSLEKGIEYLVQYPYGCLEQRASKILPLIYLEQLVKAFKIDGIKEDKIREIVQTEIDQINQFQAYDGGFKYWKTSRRPSVYLTAYALLVLNEAKDKNYNIPNDIIKKAKDFLSKAIERKLYYIKYLSYETKAFICYVLAEVGHPKVNFQNKIFDNYKSISLAGQAFLAMAYKKSGGSSSKIDDLMDEIQTHAVLSAEDAHFEDSYDNRSGAVHFFSNNRATAIILKALAEIRPNNNLIPKIVRWLLKSRRNGKWKNTHESAFCLMGLATYYEVFESQSPNFKATVDYKDKNLLKTSFEEHTLKVENGFISQKELENIGDAFLEFTKSGSGMMFYSASMQYYPVSTTLPAVDEGFIIYRQFRKLGDKPSNYEDITKEPEVYEFKRGDSIVVTITLISPFARNYVVVDSKLPGGLEAVNLNFVTTSSNLSDQMYKANRGNWYFNFKEIKDDRVVLFANSMQPGVFEYSFVTRATTKGEFMLQPTKAEEMYNPENFGRTAYRKFIVK